MNSNINGFFSIAIVLIGFQLSFCKDTVKQIHNGVQIKVGEQNLKVQFYADNLVRVVKWLTEATPESSSLVVIQKELPNIHLAVKENDTTVIIGSEKLQLFISKTDGTVEFVSSDNKTILKEDGTAIITRANIKKENAYSIKQQFKLTPDEGIYGLGQHQYGYMNYRGRTVKLVQTNTDAVSPFLISTMNYGILWDNYSKTIFTDKNNETSLWSDVANCIDYYFIYGSSMDSVIAGYRNLTGQAPMYGKWAYGYWQSKEHYENRDELLSVVQEYRKRQIPVDNIIQDWDYWDGASNLWPIIFRREKISQSKRND